METIKKRDGQEGITRLRLRRMRLRKRVKNIYRFMLRIKIKRILIGLLIGLYIAESAILIAGALYFGF